VNGTEQRADVYANPSVTGRFHLRQPVLDGPASADRMVDNPPHKWQAGMSGQEGKIITKAVEYWDLIPLM